LRRAPRRGARRERAHPAISPRASPSGKLEPSPYAHLGREIATRRWLTLSIPPTPSTSGKARSASPSTHAATSCNRRP